MAPKSTTEPLTAYRVVWAPSATTIAVVQARSAKKAKALALRLYPQYRKYPGEVYVITEAEHQQMVTEVRSIPTATTSTEVE